MYKGTMYEPAKHSEESFMVDNLGLTLFLV